MKPIVNLRWSVLGVALLCAMGTASALTLGRPRSVVLLGQPLELTVPVQFGADEDALTACFDADVFYGDIRQDRTRVALTAQPSTASSQLVNVRVVSQAGVDEPVVTVVFKAGCDHKTTRRYVLLADLVTDVDAPASVAPFGEKSLAASAVPIKPRVAAPKSPAAVRADVPTSAPAPAKRPPKVEKVAPPPAVPATQVRALKPVTQPMGKSRARLKLAPLDLGVERDPVLRSTDILLGAPLEDLEKRAQAVANWRALNASPEEILQQDARVASMRGDVSGLRELTDKNHQALMDLSARLEKAEAQRFQNPLVYGLVAALIACLAGIAFIFWRLGRRGGNAAPWWRDSETPVTADPLAGDAPHTTQTRANSKTDWSHDVELPSTPGQSTHDSAVALQDVDIDLDVRDSEYGAFASQVAHVPTATKATAAGAALPVAAHGHRDFAHSVTASLRAINTQEMLDVRQQAEFFMTLGQHEEAIYLLEDSINRSLESNPLVYLDLLKILHTLSRKAEYDRYREVFNALFSGRVPAYTHFFQQGHGLDAYEDVCQHLVSLWPTEGALQFIEQCLVHSHDALLAHEFDLEAFRDLLTLHGVLRRLISSGDSGLVPFSTFKPQALAENGAARVTAGGPDAFAHDQTAPVEPLAATDMGVDLDLSESANNLLEFEDVSFSLTPLDKEPKR